MKAEGVERGFSFSQTSLSAWDMCRRRFFLRYVRRLQWPAALTRELAAWEEAARRGQLFHQLVHQHGLGLDVGASVGASGDPLLQAWWRAFCEHPPQGVPGGAIFAETPLSAPLGGWRLLAKYDRLVFAEDGRVCIVDWKTGRSEPQQAFYEQSWQSLVYRYVLVEAGAALRGGAPIEPEQVSLVYWHARFPSHLRPIAYSRAEHEAAGERLRAELEQIVGQRGEASFPMTGEVEKCARCEYRSYCERGRTPSEDWEVDEDDLDWDLIPEAEL